MGAGGGAAGLPGPDLAPSDLRLHSRRRVDFSLIAERPGER